MLLKIPGLLSPAEASAVRERLLAANWIDGNATSGELAARAKANLQLAEADPLAGELGAMILDRLGRSAPFLSAALPRQVYPPLFNRYDAGMGFSAHVDNAIRRGADGRPYRTDLSCTLFLSDPADYDGGELIIEGVFGQQGVKLAAGDLVLYPSSSVHRVEPVRGGVRLASFFWLQSMVRSDEHRRLLHDLDQAIIAARGDLPADHPSVVTLVSTYHNLVRLWADV